MRIPPTRTLTLALLATLALTLALLPGTPAVREAAWRIVVSRGTDVGIDLRISSSTGNLWRGVTLSAVELNVAGSALEIGELNLRWSWQRLWAGEVRVSVDAQRVAGELDADALLKHLEGAVAPTGASPLPLRVIWDDLQVEVGELELSGAPFTLPDFTIRELRGAATGEGWQLSASLQSADGRLDLRLWGAFGSAHLAGALEHADVRVARTWWEGLEAGSVAGRFEWDGDRFNGDFEVTDGALAIPGLQVTAIHGPIVWSDEEIVANLRAGGLGGQVAVDLSVDVANRRWQAEGDFDLPLTDASRTGLDLIGFGSLPPATGGAVRGSLNAAGWQTYAIDISAEMNGVYLGAELQVPAITLTYGSEHGAVAAAAGLWGGGPLQVAIRTDNGPLDLRATLREVDLGPVSIERFDLTLADALSTSLSAQGMVAGTPWSLGLTQPAGSWRGELQVEAFGQLALDDRRLWGAGLLAGQNFAAVAVPALAWRLDGELGAELQLWVADSQATFGGDLATTLATISLPLNWGEAPVTLRGDLREGALALNLDLPDAGQLLATATLEGMTVALKGRAASLAMGLHPAAARGGALELDGDVDGWLHWRPGEALTGEIDWRLPDGASVRMVVDGAEFDAIGDDIALAWRDGHLKVEAASAPLQRYLTRTDVEISLQSDLQIPFRGDAQGAGRAALSLVADSVAGAATVDFDPAGDGNWEITVVAAPLSLGGSGVWQPRVAPSAVAGEVHWDTGEVATIAWKAGRLGVEHDGQELRFRAIEGLRGQLPGTLDAALTFAGETVALTLRSEGGGWSVQAEHPRFAADLSGAGLQWSMAFAAAASAGLQLAVAADGEGLAGSGLWSLVETTAIGDEVEPTTLRGGVRWHGDRLAFELQAAGARLRSPLGGVDGTSGRLDLELAAAGWRAEGDLQGRLSTGAGDEIELSLSARNQDLTLTLDGTIVGVATRLTASGSPLPSTAWRLTGSVAELPVNGRWGGLGRDDSELTIGDDWGWSASAGAGAWRGPADARATIDWSNDPTPRVAARLEVGGETGELLLVRDRSGLWGLDFAFAETEAGYALRLAGPLDATDLEGELQLTEIAFPLSVRFGAAAGVRWGDLALTLVDGGVRLAGATAIGQLPFLSLASEALEWSPANGWRGGVEVASHNLPQDLTFSGRLTGAGDLIGRTQWRVGEVPLGGVDIHLGADPRQGVGLVIDVATTLPAWPTVEWRLAGPLQIGSAGADGELRMEIDGDVVAEGGVTVQGPNVSLALAGRGLTLALDATAAAWNADLRLDDLDLAGLLPALTDARLSGRGNLQGSPSEGTWRLDEWQLRAEEGTLTGSLAGRVDGAAGHPVSGTLVGAGSLSPYLAADWQGEIDVSGSWLAPIVQGNWQVVGEGTALAGGLMWGVAEQQLHLGAVGQLLGNPIDVDLSLTAESFSGGGEVRAGGRIWELRSVEGALWLLTPDIPEQPLVRVDAGARLATVALAIADLLPGEGHLMGGVAWPLGEGLRVDLSWSELSLVGVEFGSGRLTGDPFGELHALGSHPDGGQVSGQRSAATGAWSLALVGLATPLAGSLDVRAANTASADGVSVEGRWRTMEGDFPADVQWRANPSEAGWEGSLAGMLAGGDLRWPWTYRAGELAGTGELLGAALAGVPLAATIDILGEVGDPSIAVELQWGATDLRGRVWPTIDLALQVDGSEGARLLGGWDAPLRVEGATTLALGAVTVVVQAPGSVRVAVAGLGGGLHGDIPDAPLRAALEEVLRDGWTWQGFGDWSGSLKVGGKDQWLQSERLSVASDFGIWHIDGALEANGGMGGLVGDLRGSHTVLRELLDWDWEVPIEAVWGWDGVQFTLRATPPWDLALTLDPRHQRAQLAIDLRQNNDVWRGSLAFEEGWSGALQLRSEGSWGGEPLRWSLDIDAQGAALALAGTVGDSRGSATLAGRWNGQPLIPAAWLGVEDAAEGLALDARILDLDLGLLTADLPISGRASGAFTLRQGWLLGRLSSDGVDLGGRSVRASVDVQANVGLGLPIAGAARIDLGDAQASVDLDSHGIGVLLQLERYALGDWVGLWAPGSDVALEASGAVRGRWAWGEWIPSDLRVTLEPMRLERAGSVSHGRLAIDWDGERLTIGDASFDGDGAWRLRGEASPSLLDLELLAQAADFGPILGLVPEFVTYAVGARGDLVVRLQGTPAMPYLVVFSDDLALQAAGTEYHLSGLRLSLLDDRWNARSDVRAVSPMTGALALTSSGVVRSWLDADFTLAANAIGALDVPFLGVLEELEGTMTWTGGQPPELRASGALGNRFQVDGTLAPLDLRAVGGALTLAVPFLAIAEAQADVDLRLVGVDDGVALSGRVDASSVRVDLAARARYLETLPLAATETAGGDSLARNARDRFSFAAVRLVAPQRVAIAEPFASGDLAVDLTLDGSAADPRLSGNIRALRGSVRFSGRDLEIVDGVASFDPTRGVYPRVRITGQALFEKGRVAGPGVRFMTPSGPTFEVALLLEGEMQATADGFSLDLQPTLTSNATIEGGSGQGARPLSENEILTLLTLGRVELTGGAATAVAQSALDTAIDLLLANEIQAALSSALGVDVVELRTTAIANLLDGEESFGVSLRLGGYLSDEVFASYRVATGRGDFVASEVAVAYQLGPVALDITGRFDVGPGADNAPASLALGARYGLAQGLNVEFGFDLSSGESATRIGVSWRW